MLYSFDQEFEPEIVQFIERYRSKWWWQRSSVIKKLRRYK